VNNAQESLAVIKNIFSGEMSPARDIVLLNAGAAIYAADLCDSLAEGIQHAAEVIDSGEAMIKLNALVSASNA
jgi:anthranilate phosphoribosyltransferase